MKNKIIYAITVEDVFDVAKEEKIPFSKSDLRFIEDKIGDFMGDSWYRAIVHALTELKSK